MLPRYVESLIRMLIGLRPHVGTTDSKALAKRFARLWSALEPEDEFAMILAWLGKCRLVHKLSQEQLPIDSTQAYRVPDLLAIFDYQSKTLPVLIEVKTSRPPASPLSKDSVLSGLKPGYLRYAGAVGLPMLVAWRHLGFWTLFDMRRATLAKVNYKIDFSTAMRENLLGVLAGDFSYRLIPGTAIRMRVEKLSEADATGGFEGRITDVYFINADGERLPEIPHLSSLFLLLDNDVELVDEGDAVVQTFVLRDTKLSEFASRTLPQILQAFADMSNERLDWRQVIHDIGHWAHSKGEFRAAMGTAARLGVVTNLCNFRPKHLPEFF